MGRKNNSSLQSPPTHAAHVEKVEVTTPEPLEGGNDDRVGAEGAEQTQHVLAGRKLGTKSLRQNGRLDAVGKTTGR